MEQPEIKYPCQWTYRIIGMKEEQLRNIIKVCLGTKKYELTAGNTSSKGKYISLNLETRVNSQKQRDEIFKRLSQNPEVKMII